MTDFIISVLRFLCLSRALYAHVRWSLLDSVTLTSPQQTEQFATMILGDNKLAEATSSLRIGIHGESTLDSTVAEARRTLRQCQFCLLWVPWTAAYACIQQAFALVKPYYLQIHVQCPCIVHAILSTIDTSSLRFLSSLHFGSRRNHSEAARGVLQKLYHQTASQLTAITSVTVLQSSSLWQSLADAPPGANAKPTFSKLVMYGGTLFDLLLNAEGNMSPTITRLVVFTTKYDDRLVEFLEEDRDWTTHDILGRLPQNVTSIELRSRGVHSDTGVADLLCAGLADPTLFPKLRAMKFDSSFSLSTPVCTHSRGELENACLDRKIKIWSPREDVIERQSIEAKLDAHDSEPSAPVADDGADGGQRDET